MCSRDSLLFLDDLIDWMPSLVALSVPNLLPKFIGLIAQRQSVRADASGHRQQKALIVNPSSQMSTQKWRGRVLEPLTKIFNIVVKNKQGCRSPGSTGTTCCCDGMFVYGPNQISLHNVASFKLR